MSAIISLILSVTFMVLFVVTKDMGFLTASGLFFISFQIAVANVNSAPTHKYFKLNLDAAMKQFEEFKNRKNKD